MNNHEVNKRLKDILNDLEDGEISVIQAMSFIKNLFKKEANN